MTTVAAGVGNGPQPAPLAADQQRTPRADRLSPLVTRLRQL
jgi:hypothetical protein